MIFVSRRIYRRKEDFPEPPPCFPFVREGSLYPLVLGPAPGHLSVASNVVRVFLRRERQRCHGRDVLNLYLF